MAQQRQRAQQDGQTDKLGGAERPEPHSAVAAPALNHQPGSCRERHEQPEGEAGEAPAGLEAQERKEDQGGGAGRVALRDRLLEEARTIPGVVQAPRQVTVPFWSSWDKDLHVAGIDSVDRLGVFDLNAVSPGYFAMMGTRLLRGRAIARRTSPARLP